MKYGAVLLAIIISLPLMTMQPQGDASSPSTFYVGGSGAGNYTTIQDAIDAASDGDTIYVYPGTYKENVVADKGVNIIGVNATIDGGKTGDTVLITANHTSISGFLIENSSSTGAGIVIEAGHIEIHECTIENNFYGIYTDCHNCHINISHNNFINNSHNAWDSGGNTWDDGAKGNYWDDYKGNDEDMDGIGDSPYPVEGGTGQDNYPLIYPYGLPVAIFMYTPDGLEIKFDGSFSVDYNGVIENYTWNLGDGNVSYGEEVNHTYNGSGIYEVTLTVKDTNGKTDVSTQDVIVDIEAPSTSCNFMPEQANGDNGWYISNVWLNFNASDSLSGIDYTKYKIDGNSWKIYDGNAFIREDGNHSIQYYSADKYGNAESIKYVSVKIDKTAPYTTVEPHENESVWYKADTLVSLEGHDNTSGIYATNYRINGGVFVQYNQEIDVTSEGINVIDYYSKDNAGNAEKLKSVEIKIDKTNPAMDVKAPKKSYLYLMGREIIPLSGFNNFAIVIGSTNVNVDVRDSISGVKKVEFYVDNSLKETLSEPPYTWNWNEVAVGPYTLKAVAYDNAGNKVSAEIPVMVFNIQY